MPEPAPDPAAGKGALHVADPAVAESHWQPVPANGHVSVLLAPHIVAMEHPFAMGTQTVPPGSHVREHAHDRNEEAIHVLAGQGTAVIEGERHRMAPGITFFLGRNRRHMFVNDGTEDLTFLWLMLPNGLETFFRAIGRERRPGDPVPANFPRPDDVLEIERRTVFAPPPGAAG